MKTTVKIAIWMAFLAPLAGGAATADDKPEYLYGQWENGPFEDAYTFPIGVWLQDPAKAPQYQDIGINMYIGLWKGPTEEQLAELETHGMPVICDQNEVGLANLDNPIIAGWMQQDEPDNAQPVTDPETGSKSYGPPVSTTDVIRTYMTMKANDPTRPVFLNLGQGVANDDWKGRGPHAHDDDYLYYVWGCDILSFDIYPVAGLDKPDSEELLWYVAKGVDRLRRWTVDKKIVWNIVECTRISNPKKKATPHQVRAMVWMSIIHGSRGIVYFAHEFKPKFNESALLSDAKMAAAVKSINGLIQDLAPVIHTPNSEDAVMIRTRNARVPVDYMVKRHEGYTYLFAVNMQNLQTTASIELADVPAGADVEVLGENRKLNIRNGLFEDAFKPFDVHIYRVRHEELASAGETGAE